MEQSHTFRSSNLETGTYEDASKTMAITFRSGATYTYTGVPLDHWQGLTTTDSPGRYLNDHIKDRYPHRKG